MLDGRTVRLNSLHVLVENSKYLVVEDLVLSDAVSHLLQGLKIKNMESVILDTVIHWYTLLNHLLSHFFFLFPLAKLCLHSDSYCWNMLRKHVALNVVCRLLVFYGIFMQSHLIYIIYLYNILYWLPPSLSLYHSLFPSPSNLFPTPFCLVLVLTNNSTCVSFHLFVFAT